MKKILIMMILTLGVQGASVAECDLCIGNGIGIDPIGGVDDGPTPVGGDDVPHLAEVLYYRGTGSFPILYRSQVFGRDRSDCGANLDNITTDPSNSVVAVTKPCTPAY